MLTKIKKELLETRELLFSRVGIYRNQSLFFEYLINNEILVISYHSLDHKIYFYFRSKQDISYYLKSLQDLGFLLNKHLLMFDTKGRDFASITAIFAETLNRIEGLLNVENIKAHPYSADKKRISGFYLDDKNNHVIAPNVARAPNIQFLGGNNYLQIKSRCDLSRLEIIFQGSNSRITIAENVEISGGIYADSYSHIIIREDVTSHGVVDIYCATDHKIMIDRDCFFEGMNVIRAADRYRLKDLGSNNVLFAKKEIVLGRHIYVAYGAKLLSGAKIGDHSVVNEFSLLDKSFPKNTLASGNPAVVVRKDITWIKNISLTSE